jgi:hypothetical protein
MDERVRILGVHFSDGSEADMGHHRPRLKQSTNALEFRVEVRRPESMRDLGERAADVRSNAPAVGVLDGLPPKGITLSHQRSVDRLVCRAPKAIQATHG